MGSSVVPWLFSCVLVTYTGTTRGQSAKNEMECNREAPGRQLISTVSSGNLVFRQKKDKSNGLLPCQWFVDGSSFGTNVALTVSAIVGECGFQSCIVVFDGDSLEDQPLSLLSPFTKGSHQKPVLIVSSTPKIFIQIAASCDGLSFMNATFQVLNCTGCAENCSNNMPDHCDVRCAYKCTTHAKKTDHCDKTDVGCSCTSGGGENCYSGLQQEILDLWTDVSRKGSYRMGHTAIPYNSSMWIYGGYNFVSTFDSVEVFSLAEKTWKIVDSKPWLLEYPVGRYLHSAVLFDGSQMMVYGGINARHTVMGDFWSFNFISHSWTKLESYPVPPLAAHTATLVGGKMFIVGGFSKNGSPAPSMYVWSATDKKWSIESPRNGEDHLIRVAGHTAVYYAPLSSLIVFGGMRGASTGGQLYMYHVKQKIWTAVGQQFSPNSHPRYTQLVFHTANIVANYMVITGGYDVGNARSCREGSVYLYHLDCQVFLASGIFEEKNLSIPDLSRFGHSSIVSGNNLVLYGGLSDVVMNELGFLQLPDFVISNGYHCVKDYTDRVNCEADLSCVWCSKSSELKDQGVCVGHYGAQVICGSVSNPACPGLCPILSSCTNCLAFKDERQCSWCSKAGKCVVNVPTNRDNCLDKRAKDSATWWNQRPQSVEFVDHCQLQQFASGLTVLLYQPDPDLSMPDEVNLIDNSALSFHPIVRFPPDRESGILIVEMKGFLHPLGASPKSTWDTQLRMWERTGNSMGFDGVAQLWLSKDSDPSNAELVAESRGIFPIRTEVSRHDGTPLFPDSDGKYFIKFVYQMTVMRGRLPPDFDVHLYLTWNGNSIVTQAFESRHLEPFSSDGESCAKLETCLRCLSDMSCGWCPTTKECYKKPADPSNYSPCINTDGNPMYLNVDFGQCIACTPIIDPLVCNQEKHCKWDVVARGCFRSSLVSIDRAASSEPDCTKHSSCSPCVHAPEKCIWCHSMGQCLTRESLNIFSAFGQCRFWEDNDVADPCTDCKEIRDCEVCLSRPSCGWCSKAGKDPRLGECLTGNLIGTNATDDLVCPRSGNVSVAHVWSYSTCPDVDECALGIADCHVNATCVNTRGHYRCECAQGYKGDGRAICVKTCDQECINGKCSDVLMPNLEPFKCICDLGWTGAQCNIDCGCNFHSTCIKNVSHCDQCFGNTEGQYCERCVKGTFGNATVDKGCLPCSCNGHADPNQPCDSVTGRCYCEYPYFGRNCEKCPPEFYGQPLNGGICYHRCRSRTLIINATTGGLGNESDQPEGFCLWILVSGKEDYFGDRLPITLTIADSMEVLCPNNSIVVINGFPDWLAAPDITTDLAEDDTKLFDLWEVMNRPSSTLGNICGPLRNPMVLTSKSGIMTVVLRRSSRSEKFNATYSLDLAHERATRGLPVVWMASRVGHSVRIVKNVAYLFGGLDPLKGMVNELWAIGLEALVGQAGWTVLDDHNSSRPLPRYFHSSCAVGEVMMIHGGFVENADRVHIGSDLWVYNASRKIWKELNVKNLARLAGHTMTVVKDVIYIIGGAAESFSDTVYTYKITEQGWRVFPANGSRPPGLYGHTATYYPIRNAIFVYGGFRFDVDRSGMSNLLSVLDLRRRRWIMMPSMTQENPLSPRMFHAAKYVRDGNYILIAGFSYAHPYMTFSPVRAIENFCPRYTTTGACLSTLGCGMCISGTENGSFCFDNSGPGVVGCGFRGNMYPGITCDENLSVMRICREQTECRTCVAPWIGVGEDDSRCQWCTNCGNGLCIARYETCETSLSCNRSNAVIREPGMCPDERCHAADCQKCLDSRPSCFWTRHFQRSTETVKKFRKTPVFPWNCFPQELFQKIAPTVEGMEAAPPDECPVPCNAYLTCTDCLNSGGAAGGSQQCAWSEDNKECMNPSMVNLRCPLGNCGALMYGGSRDRCPREPKTITVCRECLKVSKAGWCAVDGTNGQGFCMLGGISGPILGLCAWNNNISQIAVVTGEEGKGAVFPITALHPENDKHHTWHFLTCPPENECINGHHTCDEHSEDCHNTVQGFNCTCKPGFASVPAVGDPERAYKCVPICTQGCRSGRCVAPETCDCDFGFVGANCTVACQCNGHSDCPSEAESSKCIQCMNNTIGEHCEKCKDGFVGSGDPRNGGRCLSCTSYCNDHSSTCLTLGQIFNLSSESTLPDNPFLTLDVLQLKSVLDRDHSSDLAMCYKCDGNTTGFRCDSCLPGFFRPPALSKSQDSCRACECNGHDDTCNSLTGTNCKCANNTATDPVCDGNDKKDLPSGMACWTVQCAQCKEYFVGRPTGGHQCYRQMSVGEDYCFDPEIPRGRCTSWDSSKPLRYGRSVFFAVQPKYLNVDIRIYADVTIGGIDLHISDQEDMFVINVDKKNGFQSVQIDKKYMANSRGIDDVVDFHRAADVITYVSASEQGKVVTIRDIRHRLVLSIPYVGHDLKQSKFYVVVHGVGSPSSDFTRGRILFRQDQPHIDLFVFFSVFFSCFFLFLAVCILLWKFKLVYGVRQNRQRVAIELQTMAKRPFGKVFLVFDKHTKEKAADLSLVLAERGANAEEPSTSGGIRRMLRKKKRNVVDVGQGSSPRAAASTDGTVKLPSLMPVALEYLHGGVVAVATLPVQLPGGPDCPVRFCLASTLVHAPQYFNALNVKND